MANPIVCDAVEAVLAAEWTHSEYPLILPNTSGAPPKAGTPYMRVDYPISEAKQASFGSPGSNFWREIGVFRIILFSPRGKGTAIPRELAQEIATMFRGRRITEAVHCWAPSIANDPEGDEATYYITAIAVEYWADIIG